MGDRAGASGASHPVARSGKRISGGTAQLFVSLDGLGRARLGAWTTPPPDADDLFCDAVCTVVLAALERIGGDQEARFALFKKLLVAAQEAAGERDS